MFLADVKPSGQAPGPQYPGVRKGSQQPAGIAENIDGFFSGDGNKHI